MKERARGRCALLDEGYDVAFGVQERAPDWLASHRPTWWREDGVMEWCENVALIVQRLMLLGCDRRCYVMVVHAGVESTWDGIRVDS